MSTTLAEPQICQVASDRPKRWTTAEFDHLVGTGSIEEGCDTYLWEGQIVIPMPEYQPHINAVRRLFIMMLARFAEAEWTVSQSPPLDVEDGTKPQPDFLVTRGPRSRYRVKPPIPSDVALLIEVSVSTYDRDSGERYRKYAKVRIPQYWIVNVAERRVEVYLNPQVAEDGTASYQSRTDYQLDQSIPLNVTHEGLTVTGEIAVMDILRDSLAPENPQGPA